MAIKNIIAAGIGFGGDVSFIVTRGFSPNPFIGTETLAVTEVSVPTILRKISHTLSVVETSIGTILKKVTKTLVTVSTGTAVLDTVKLTLQALVGTAGSTVTLTPLQIVGQTLSVASASVAGLVKQSFRTLATVTSTILGLTAVSNHFKTLVATAGSIVTLGTVKLGIKALTVTVSSIPGLNSVRFYLKTLAATAGSTLTLVAIFIAKTVVAVWTSTFAPLVKLIWRL